jgi:peptidoglycan/LPS O-acetylase OafA/YrhL
VRRDYREDIDWLRAIAVLAVVAFHFEAPAVFGGFVGVDIFFVISGYLITGIIQSEVTSGTFSFARFYERRVRRLLPALYAMVVLTAIPSFHYLLTSERAEFFRSVAAVITFTSNFFFWFQTGYFDHAAVEKPLLHTWSLAVEEQFYLVWPVLLVVALRRRIRPDLLIVGIAAAGFVTALVLADRLGMPATYRTPFPHVPVLAAGVLLAVGLDNPDHRLVRRITGWLRRSAAGWFAALVLVAALFALHGDRQWLYWGGFLVFGLIATVLVGHLVLAPGSSVARTFSFSPLCGSGAVPTPSISGTTRCLPFSVNT